MGFKPVQPFGRLVTRRGFIQLWGLWVSVLSVGRGLAMEDAGWTLPPFMCFGCSDALGQGRPARFCRCCGLWPCIRRTWAGTFRASRSESDSGGLAAPL